MPTRHFFRKAVAPPPKPPCESHRRKYPKRMTAISEMEDPLTGARMVRKTNASWAFRKMAASKAGKASQASGNANRFTSESGSKASKKLWKTRQRLMVRPGPPGKVPNTPLRIGVKLSGRKRRLNRGLIRTQSLNPRHGIHYVPMDALTQRPGFWQRTDPDTGVTVSITERTALTRLGYIRKLLRFVPTSVRLLPLPGTKSAVGGTDNPVPESK